jgi:hypothetical protein
MNRDRTVICYPALAALVLLTTGPPSSRADEPEVVTYREVKAILKSQCFKCHSPEERRGRLDMTTYGALMQGSASGPVVVKGNADESLLYLVVTHQEEPRMPPGSPKMPDDRLELIRRWIAAGAPERPGDATPQASSSSATKPASSTAAMKASAPESSKTSSPANHSPRARPQPVRPTALTALAASPDGALLAVSDQSRVVLFDVGRDAARARAALPFPEGEVYALRFGRDGRTVLAAGGKHVESGAAVLFEVESGRRLGLFGDESDVVLSADMSPDGRLIAIGGPGRVVKVFGARDGRLRHRLKRHTDWVLSVAYSPDGLLVATSDRAGNTFVWEAETGAEVHALRGHNAAVTALGWDPSGDRLYTAGDDGLVNAWDMHKGTALHTWRAHEKGVLGLGVASNGALATVGRDLELRLWSPTGVEAGKPIGPIGDLPGLVAPLAGGRWAVGDWGGRLSLWETSGQRREGFEPIRLAVRELPSPPAMVVSTEEVEPSPKPKATRVAAPSSPARPVAGRKSPALAPARLSADADDAERVLTGLLDDLRERRRKLADDEAMVRAAEARLSKPGAPASDRRRAQRLDDLARTLAKAADEAEALLPPAALAADASAAGPAVAPSRELFELALLLRLASDRARALTSGPVDDRARAELDAATARLETSRQALREVLTRLQALGTPPAGAPASRRDAAAAMRSKASPTAQ